MFVLEGSYSYSEFQFISLPIREMLKKKSVNFYSWDQITHWRRKQEMGPEFLSTSDFVTAREEPGYNLENKQCPKVSESYATDVSINYFRRNMCSNYIWLFRTWV